MGCSDGCSFQTHGIIDVIQAVMAGAVPALLGFAGEAEAQAFYGQAAVEAGVVAATIGRRSRRETKAGLHLAAFFFGLSGRWFSGSRAPVRSR